MYKPSKHLLTFKTFSRRIQDMSWRRLQDAFNVTIFRLPRRLEEVLRASWRRLGRQKIITLKTSSRRLQDILKTCLEDVLRTCLEDVLKTPPRQTKRLLGVSVFTHGLPANLNQYLTNLYLINLYFTNLRRIRNALIRTQ